MQHSTNHSQFATSGIFPYGSPELIEFENRMARYFGREYSRWEANNDPLEAYGISSFDGEMTTPSSRLPSIKQHYDGEFQVFRAFRT